MRPSRYSASDPGLHESGAPAPVAPVHVLPAGSYTPSLLSSVGSPPDPGAKTATIVAYTRAPTESSASASLHATCPPPPLRARVPQPVPVLVHARVVEPPVPPQRRPAHDVHPRRRRHRPHVPRPVARRRPRVRPAEEVVHDRAVRRRSHHQRRAEVAVHPVPADR